MTESPWLKVCSFSSSAARRSILRMSPSSASMLRSSARVHTPLASKEVRCSVLLSWSATAEALKKVCAVTYMHAIPGLRKLTEKKSGSLVLHAEFSKPTLPDAVPENLCCYPSCPLH